MPPELAALIPFRSPESLAIPGTIGRDRPAFEGADGSGGILTYGKHIPLIPHRDGATHMHRLMPYTGRDIHRTMKWIADQTTKFVHVLTAHTGPVWARGKWCSSIGDRAHWNNTERYIDNHNRRAGRPPKPLGVPITPL